MDSSNPKPSSNDEQPSDDPELVEPQGIDPRPRPPTVPPTPLTPQERQAFVDFFGTTHPQLVGYLLRAHKLSLAQAQDVASDAMQAALIAWSTIEKPRAWCFKVARRIAIAEIRNQSTEIVKARATDLVRRGQEVDTPESALMRWFLISELDEMLESLSEDRRTVLVLNTQGFSSVEIGQILGKTASAVRNLLFNARKQAADHLRKGGKKY